MPGMDGIEATRQITSRQPKTRILVLTSFAADNKVFPAIKAGAAGYLLKDSSPDELVRAIRQVHRGEPSLHPTIARKLLQEIARPAELQPAPEALTAREMEVLRLIAQGLSNQEIADRISVSEPTVRAHVSRILGKLHLASRTQAALYAVREGLTDADAARRRRNHRPRRSSWNLYIKHRTSKVSRAALQGRPFCYAKSSVCADDRAAPFCYAMHR